MSIDKPPYRVPTMAEIRELPWNGRTVASTFSGGGGSSVGYRMAGCRVLYASEFVPAARDTYRANAADYTYLDDRDIRTVTGAEILKHAGLELGELDILDGSPPCASFSTAGAREKGWGKTKSYSDTEQRSDDLFFEFIRILADVQPRVFVAENVSGLVKGTAKGYFKQIMTAFKATGYQVEARLLNAAWLGVPQARQRLIFIGVRADLGVKPRHPSPLPYAYTVRDALPWIDQVGTAPPHSDFVATGRDVMATMRDARSTAAPTVMASGLNKGAGLVIPRVVHDTSGQYGKGEITDLPCPTVTVGVNAVNSHHYQVRGEAEPITHDPETGKLITIGQFAIAKDWELLADGGDPAKRRYQSSAIAAPDDAAPTITASGGGLSTAGVMHPTQCRKFTLAELRAICGFPADFQLTGTYEQRWERLGRAVPPVMMSHIANTICNQVLTQEIVPT